MTAEQLATVIALPVRGAEGTIGALRRLIADDVDDWGRDHGFVNRFWSIAKLRWDVAVGGAGHLPRRQGALVVVNARRFALAPLFAAMALSEASGRPVRFAGRPDVAPVGPALQRLGGLLGSPDEVGGALRAGQVVVIGADATASNQHCGQVDHRYVAKALSAGVHVLPAATSSSPTTRAARVELGTAVRRARRRRGPLEEFEVADAVRERIDELLVESGGALAGTPLDWIDWAGLGWLGVLGARR